MAPDPGPDGSYRGPVDLDLLRAFGIAVPLLRTQVRTARNAVRCLQTWVRALGTWVPFIRT